jgi:capsular exopolysaccharide synthesis family protein
MTTTQDQHQSDLHEYIRVVRARKYEIALVTVVVVVVSLFFTFRQTPIYEGQTKVLVKPELNPSTTVSVPQQPNLDTERELILSRVVADKVKEDGHLAASAHTLLQNAKVEVVTDTEVLLIKYDDPNPTTAARIANTFATAYIEFRNGQTLDQFQAATSAVQKRIDGIQSDLTTLDKKIASENDPDQKGALQSQRDTLIAQMGVLQNNLLTLQANASTAQSSAELVQPAEIPTSPASPNKVRNTILALLAGLALGVGFAFLRERLDDRITSRHELERRVGAPVLAAVPRVMAWRQEDEAYLIMHTDPKSPVAEAYRTLGTNVQYLASQQPMKIIMVTSSIGGDGKTTTSSNLGMVLAHAGRRVILVSADLRRPRVHRFFNLPNETGMSDVLMESLPLAKVTQDPGVANLRVISGGPIPSDPAALLGSQRTADFIRSMKEVADYIILDCPPVLAVADASILAPLVDGIIFVLDAEHSSRSALMQARDQLQNAGGRVIGAVYNNFDPNSVASYPYGYYNYYYQYYGTDEHSANGNGTAGRKPRTRRRGAKVG